MPKMFNYSGLLLFLLILFPRRTMHAQVKIDIIDSTSLYSYEWYLFKMANTNLNHVDLSSFPNLLFFPGENGKFTGEGECNEIEGRIKLSGKNKIHIDNITEDVYECDHDLDRKFIKMLQQVDHYKIKNDQLKLYSRDGILLGKFYAEISHLCYYKMTGLDGEWIQNTLAKPSGWVDLDVLDTLPSITFSKSNSESITGFTGCNSFSAHFTLEDYQIHLSEIQNLKENDCASDLEKNFINDLSVSTMFWLGNELLSFWKGNTMVMDFKRVNDLTLTKGPASRFLEKKLKNTIYTCGNR
jgi:heat shock protein HslJ